MKKAKSVSPYLLVLLSFVGVILLGALLLCMPFSRQANNWGSFIDALFTATSATCVTGLCTYVNGIGQELTFFGQLIVLVMIQIGGLGFITILTFFISLFIKKLQFKDRLFLSQAVNSNSVSQVGAFVRRVVAIVVISELVGFLLGLPVFLNVPGLSIGDAIWNSIFMSISAFNNAGFDIMGGTSLIRGAGNSIIDNMPLWAYYYMQSYLMILIILGGISFITIIDVIVLRKRANQLNAFVKIVLLTTGILLVVGFVAFILTDVTKGNISVFNALFQSVTCRTAGFATFNENDLSIAGKTISCVLMFIGGSPISTAGGIKTTTVFMLVLSLIKFLQGKQIVAFTRQYSRISILKAMVLVLLSIFTIVVAFILVKSFEEYRKDPFDSTENIFFEVFSAFGTTGLSTGITPTLSIGSKIVLSIVMFFGRLGPITLFQVFQSNMDKEENTHFKYVEADLIVG